jgi:hypothetical protein
MSKPGTSPSPISPGTSEKKSNFVARIKYAWFRRAEPANLVDQMKALWGNNVTARVVEDKADPDKMKITKKAGPEKNSGSKELSIVPKRIA